MSETKEVKPRSRATINPTSDQILTRNIGRIKTLKLAIVQAMADGNTKREASLQSEIDRRMEQVNAVKEELANL